MKTFKHSGDIGDIIYALPTIKALGGGMLYLSINKIDNQKPGMPTKFNLQGVNALIPLLKKQPYITDATLWNNEKVDYNLDEFRHQNLRENLARTHCKHFKVDENLVEQQWLWADKIELPEGRKFVFARSSRYHGDLNWGAITQAHAHQAVFVGLPQEYEEFCKAFNCKDRLLYMPTKDYWELACIINSCELFYGNQSSPYAVAQGLHIPNILERCNWVPNCDFKRIEKNEKNDK